MGRGNGQYVVDLDTVAAIDDEVRASRFDLDNVTRTRGFERDERMQQGHRGERLRADAVLRERCAAVAREALARGDEARPVITRHTPSDVGTKWFL